MHWVVVIAVVFFPITAEPAFAQIDFERAPIHYHSAVSHDRVAKLIAALDAGETELTAEGSSVWLLPLLKALEVDVDTQNLVFSKTSLQISKISPRTPRAVYFNDDIYVGWVPGGDLIELGAIDPKLGAVFYTLDQTDDETPKIERVTEQCLSCHGTSRTKLVPGFLTRSMVTRKTGHPDYGFNSEQVDHTIPFKDRFGGWYVTGTHGEMRHMGNAFSDNADREKPLDLEPGANCTDLTPYFSPTRYPSPHSDIVALMVLDHQSQMHNLITAAAYAHSRAQFNYDRLFTPPEDRDSYVRERCVREVNRLVEGLLFGDEFQLTSPVAGTTTFRERFEKLGPADSQGRSLRQFDLQTRLLKYPCSYLVYSDGFRGLPPLVLDLISKRLDEVLSSEPGDEEDPFRYLTVEDRKAIREILIETASHLSLGKQD